MAVPNEVTLPQLLRYLNVDPATFTFPCAFCSVCLDIYDKARFATSNLKVVYKDKTYKGCCLSCRCKLAAAERQRYLVCTGEGDLVEAMCGTGIVHCAIRCVVCLALLTASEKLLAKVNRHPFFLVRHMWRGFCRHCNPAEC